MAERNFKDRVALITGAASGIGLATARRFLKEGARVVLADINEGPAKGDLFLRFDVASKEGWQEAYNAIKQDFARLDVLVNNAGVGSLQTIEETTLDDYKKVIAIDQTSVFLGMKIMAPLLEEKRGGSIINVSSIFATSGGFGTSPAYHAAKGAITTLTKNAAIHWAPRIRVNSIHPGFIDTPMLDVARGTPFEEKMIEATPMRRLGRPEEVAASIAYLASDDASFVTGSELYVDGGYKAL